MVFKTFSHLSRQSFTKSLTHGYAQSVVAATQSSYASATTPLGTLSHSRRAKHNTLHHRDALKNLSFQSTSAARSDLSAAVADTNEALEAYYVAWQKHQSGEAQEWQQFQFARRIGWGNPIAVEGKTEKDATVHRPDVTRAHTTSAVHDIKRIESEAAEAIAVANANEAIADTVADLQQASGVAPRVEAQNPSLEPTTARPNDVDELTETDEKASSDSASATTAKASTPTGSLPSDNTAVSPITLHDDPYVEHLRRLQDLGRYAEIPAVFESMLRAGTLPTTQAYNALISAAVHLPAVSHQVVPKVLEVYAHMLRNKVSPDTATYTLLLEVLALRSMEVSDMKAALAQKGLRYAGLTGGRRFMLRSQETECDILAEDDSVSLAKKLFDVATSGMHDRVFAAATYRVLLEAFAAHADIDNMIRVYSHMESNRVVPFASVYAPMIRAFARSGDLRSAVECYNEYKNLAIADDSGRLAVINRADHEVYAAIIEGYLICGKQLGAHKFFGKVADSFNQSSSSAGALQTMRDTVVLGAFTPQQLSDKRFAAALDNVERQNMSAEARNQAFLYIATSAADHGESEVATKAYERVSADAENTTTAAAALLAMYVRQGDIVSARSVWSSLSTAPARPSSLVEPTAMYAVALSSNGSVDEGLMQARQTFTRIRSADIASDSGSDLTEQIDEAIEFIDGFLVRNGITPRAQAAMGFMWAMVENGGLIAPVAEHLLAGVSSEDIPVLSWLDLQLALQVEAGILSGEQRQTLDVGHASRFAQLLETALANRMPLEKRTSDVVEMSLGRIGQQRPDLVAQWHKYRHQAPKPVMKPAYVHGKSNSATGPSAFNEAFDPYAATLDHRGSAVIVDELEKQGAKASVVLNEALARFRNIRRAGRHPRYLAYAKLIGAASRDGRGNLIHDLFGMAQQDMPLVPQYPVVRHGWTSILDAMVGACLTIGNRGMAADFHQQLLDIGAAPSANTFGLYITTLKESTKTFDEATEAVKIFHRAKSEGVEPSSFLYNALIGKLGKARRIDDCLFYFAEMRSRGIRPTSVTYGTVVNALCRVSDERFAQELFAEMESMPNYRPRPAPYNSLMQFFLTTKRDGVKVLEYYDRMLAKNIKPTMHTYKLLIDTYATLEPINLAAAEAVLDLIRSTGEKPEAVHYASLIHAKGCVLHDMDGARKIFDAVTADASIRPQACIYQALFESIVANHSVVHETPSILEDMVSRGVAMTAYIANTLIHGWASEKNVTETKRVYEALGKDKREPSTYEAMTRAYLAMDDRDSAAAVVQEMIGRGYPSAVSGKILELLGHGTVRASSAVAAAVVT